MHCCIRELSGENWRSLCPILVLAGAAETVKVDNVLHSLRGEYVNQVPR